MTITELSIKRPILIVVIFLVLGVLGIFSYNQLSYELLPKMSSPFVTVVTVYPGANPSEVENAVTKKIEEAVAGAEKLKRVFSTSSENVSTVFVEFQQSANADLATQDVQRKINEITDLPTGVKRPAVLKFQLDAIPVIRMAVTSAIPPRDFAQLLKDQIKPRLAQIKGVSQVSLVGLSEREINVNINADKLRAYNLSIVQVSEAIRRANLDVPAGRINDKDAQFGVRVQGKFENVEDLKNLVILATPQQNGSAPSVVKLSDVAEVSDGARDVETLSRLNGMDAVGVLIQKQSDANTVAVSELVRAEIEKLRSEQPAMTFSIAQDASEFTLEAANAVVHDLQIAVFLVALVMLLFLHSWRNSLIVMLSIPASLVSTFIAMYVFNFSLNLMTLLAMSLVVGILVDDSIVVLESIYQQLERGVEPRAAALKGRMDIGFSALAITLVDVVVFLPLSLVSGLIGDIMRQFALVVVISTLLSLFVSFTLTPMLASRFSRLEHLTRGTLMGRFGLWFERGFASLTDWYAGVLAWALKHRIVVALSAFALLIGSFMLPALGFIGSEFISSSDKGELSVSITLPPGTPFEETNRVVREIEKKYATMPEVRKLFTSVGSSSSGFEAQFSSNNAYIDVSLTPKAQRTKPEQEAQQISIRMKKLAQEIPGVKARVAPIGLFGQADDSPIQVLVFGANRDSATAAGRIIADILTTINGSADVRLSLEEGKPETRIDIDREKMASYGLSLEEVGFSVRTALAGNDDTKIRLAGAQGSVEYPVRIRLDADDRSRTERLKNLTFTNMAGQRVELQQFARVEQSLAPSQLDRRNRNASVIVYSKAVGRPSGTMGEELQAKIKAARLPSGVKVDYLGDLENQGDAFGSLGLALLAAILFVYLLMVALYNSWVYPFVVLFSIPVAMVGALVGLALAMKSLNIFSILGIIMMIGLVAKNAILLVDRTNAARTEGMDVITALLDAGRTRLRPIVMTTIAMVIGMLPIALADGAGGEFKSGLAVALIGGLTSSMFLTLLVVPTVYVDVEHLRSFTLRLAHKIGSRARSIHLPVHGHSHAESAESVASKEHKENGYIPETSNGKTSSTIPASENILLVLLLSILGTGIFSTSAVAQISSPRAQRLSLQEAVKIGLAQNPELAIARLEEDKAAQKVREMRGSFLPQISASFQYVRNIQAPVFFFPGSLFQIGDALQGLGRFIINQNPAELAGLQSLNNDAGLIPIRAGLYNSYTISGSVNMPIIQEDLRHAVRMSEIAQTLTSESTTAARVQKARDIKKAYYDVLMAEEQERLLRQSIMRSEETLAQVRSLAAKGLATETDTLRAYVGVENQRPMLTKIANGIRIARALLAVTLGLDSGQTLELADSLSLSLQASSNLAYEAALQQALTSRSDMKQVALRKDLADAEIASNTAAHLPSLAAFGQYQIISQSDNFDFSKQQFPNSSYVGFQVAVPIFSGFRTDAKVQQAMLGKLQAEKQFDFAKNLVGTEVRVGLASVEEARERITAQVRTVQAAERSYKAVRQRYTQGLIRQIEVSDADLALTQAKTNYFQAVYDYLVAAADLDKALGKE
ncbi:MAG: efflux RND transporter permease subunit [Ignavibacteria bacterium]|nr:efflux RND transporter permease subunit [Ignavibacteria bacterium]